MISDDTFTLISLCIMVAMLAVGMAFLAGRDWARKRRSQGLPFLPYWLYPAARILPAWH